MKSLIGLVALFSSASAAFAANSPLEEWIQWQRNIAAQRMLRNIHPAGTAPGVIVASPDREYLFHWVRDAAVVMDTLRFDRPSDFLARVGDYATLCRSNQFSNIGEPKFNLDGSAFTGPWGRPQDDGPAARASVLIAYAKSLLDQGREAEARKLYDGRLPTDSVIKADLEYISHHWRQTSFDLWEEIRGLHFFTRMLQRKALLSGAWLAQRLGDIGASQWYASQARLLQAEIPRHWNASRGILQATVQADGGIDYKSSGLDSAVLLGVLYGNTGDGFYGPSHPQVIATVQAMVQRFSEIYPINQKTPQFAPAIGRYPEDRYFGGNPWVLTTATLAEFHYQLAFEIKRAGRVAFTPQSAPFYESMLPGITRTPGSIQPLISRIRAVGDSYLERLRYHANPDGSMSEQLDRNHGNMTSMRDLTWSYAAFLRTVWVRERTR